MSALIFYLLEICFAKGRAPRSNCKYNFSLLPDSYQRYQQSRFYVLVHLVGQGWGFNLYCFVFMKNYRSEKMTYGSIKCNSGFVKKGNSDVKSKFQTMQKLFLWWGLKSF